LPYRPGTVAASAKNALERPNHFFRLFLFYILISIAKEMLQPQLNRVLPNAAEGLTLTRDQTGAVNRLRESFYEGF
jgi:hypothetical protein